IWERRSGEPMQAERPQPSLLWRRHSKTCFIQPLKYNQMKKLLTRNIMLLSAVSMSMLASAQQRQVDLEIHIEEPANASALQSGETFSLVLSVTNHGPEELLEGDTLFIVLPTREVTSGVMSSPIPVGE